MTKVNAEVVAGGILLSFSSLFLYTTFDYSYFSSSGGPGPGFFARWLSILLLVLSFNYIYTSVTRKQSAQNIIPSGSALKKMGLILSSMIGFIVLLQYLGFILTSILFLMVLFRGSYKRQTCLAISIGISVFLYWLFQIMLEIQLPTFALI